MDFKDWLFLGATGLSTVPLQAAIIHTLVRTFREPASSRPEHGRRTRNVR